MTPDDHSAPRPVSADEIESRLAEIQAGLQEAQAALDAAAAERAAAATRFQEYHEGRLSDDEDEDEDEDEDAPPAG